MNTPRLWRENRFSTQAGDPVKLVGRLLPRGKRARFAAAAPCGYNATMTGQWGGKRRLKHERRNNLAKGVPVFCGWRGFGGRDDRIFSPKKIWEFRFAVSY